VERRWLNARVLWGALAAIVGVVVILVQARESGVETDEFVKGLILGGAALALLPYVAYYSLGRVLGRHRVVLGFVWLASLAPLYYYSFVAFLWALDLVHCPPDAYECPL
jgi:hypothetical protein